MTSKNIEPGPSIFATLAGRAADGTHASLRIATADESSYVNVTFKRTVKVQDNDEKSFLPPDLGDFPLLNVDELLGLPAEIADEGGIIFPLHEREALWIKFEANAPFMIHVTTGGVNAVSGEHVTFDHENNMALRPMLDLEGPGLDSTGGNHKQGCVVVPNQDRLDGISTEDGMIRQFVAMPTGSGYAVDAQLTGADLGGFSLAFTPLRPEGAEEGVKDMKITIKWLPAKSLRISCNRFSTIEEVKCTIYDKLGIFPDEQRLVFQGRDHKYQQCSDHQTLDSWGIKHDSVLFLARRLRGRGIGEDPPMSLAAGGEIHQRIEPDPYPRSRWDTSRTLAVKVSMINARLLENIIDMNASEEGPDAKQYNGESFALSNENTTSGISGDFKGVKSVATIDESKKHDPVAQAAAKISRRATSHPVVRVTRAIRTTGVMGT